MLGLRALKGRKEPRAPKGLRVLRVQVLKGLKVPKGVRAIKAIKAIKGLKAVKGRKVVKALHLA